MGIATPAVHTPAQLNLLNLAINDMASGHSWVRYRIESRRNEFRAIEATLLAMMLNFVAIDVVGVTLLATDGSGEIMVHANVPDDHRLRMMPLVDCGFFDFDFLAGHDRQHSVLRHASGWVLFITWVKTEAIEVAA